MVVLDLDGRVVEGAFQPSSDTATHLVRLSPSPGRQRRRPHPLALRDRVRRRRPSDPRLPHGAGRRVRRRDPVRRVRPDRRRGHRRAGRRGDRAVAGDPAAEPRRLHHRAIGRRPRSRRRSWSRTSRPRSGPPSRSGRPSPPDDDSSSDCTTATPRATVNRRPDPAESSSCVDLGAFEVWFVDRQPAPVRPRDARSRRAPGARGGRRAGCVRRRSRVRVVAKPVVTDADGIRGAVPGGERRPRPASGDHLDAHVLAGEDVDRRARVRSSAHSSTCTRSTTARSRGTGSTWTS